MADTMPSSPSTDSIALSRRPAMTHRRLFLLKWLMVVIPPVTVTVGHTLLMMAHSFRHGTLSGIPERVEIVLVTSFVTLLALVISYLFVETLFRMLQRLQAEALAHEQDLLTMNGVIHERERLRVRQRTSSRFRLVISFHALWSVTCEIRATTMGAKEVVS